MWTTIGLVWVVALVLIYYTHLINKWRNPKCKNGVLPPGSMGWPIIGEILEIIKPNCSTDLHPFFKKRFQRYGPVFRTSFINRPVVISADPQVNQYLIHKEGTLIDLEHFDSFAKFFRQSVSDESRLTVGQIHRFICNIFLSHFGAESLRGSLLPQIEDTINTSLLQWSAQGTPVEATRALSNMIFNLTAKTMFGFDDQSSSDKITEHFSGIFDIFMSFPLNIPGTKFHKYYKEQQMVRRMLKDALKERMNSPEKSRGDCLDQAIGEMNKVEFITEDCISLIMYGLLFASFVAISKPLILLLKFLPKDPLVLQQLTAEHEAILKKRENPNSSLTWEEYKSMTFTHQVMNELLRLTHLMPGLFRRVMKDIEVKGYTIPAGWSLLLVTHADQFDPEKYKDPLAFNPWRWKDELDPDTINAFTPFGTGIRQCPGADYSKVFICSFIHVLVSKYNWTNIKETSIFRNPLLQFEGGMHVKFSCKHS